MTKKEALEFVHMCAKAHDRAISTGMTFVPDSPGRLREACEIVLYDTPHAPQYLKAFSCNYLGGDWYNGFPPPEEQL